MKARPKSIQSGLNKNVVLNDSVDVLNTLKDQVNDYTP